MIICAIERGLEFNVKHTTHRPQYWLRLKSHDNLYISCSAVGFLRARLAGVICREPLKPVDFPLHLPRPSAIPGPLPWLLLNRWRRISSPLQSYTHKNITMHHASKKYESSLRFDGDESICLVHFHLLQQSLFSSSLGLDGDEAARQLLNSMDNR